MSSTQNWETIIMGPFNARFGPEKTKAALQDGLIAGLKVMQDTTPVKTGRLRSSEGISVTSPTEGELFANESYASIVNDGSGNRTPQPFFDRGVALAYQRIRENMSKL